MEQKKKKNPKWKLVWFIKAPIHGLSKARDMYVKTMMGFAGRSRTTCYYSSRNNRSFITDSRKPRDEDLRELVKAVLQAEFGGDHHHQVEKGEGKIGVLVVKKSQSASVFGRIDEEDEMEFEKEEEEERKMCSLRSRSCVLVPNKK